MGKRILLFIITNVLMLVTISLVTQLLGLQPYLQANGIDYQALMIFCLVWGMAGALISLAMSRVMAKWMMGVKVINPRSPGEYSWLIEMVNQQVRAAKLPAVPEVGVYDSHEVNGFATGPTRSRSLVALSTGLIARMNRDEIAGVVAHELAHIKNGDMVTMTLIQGVVNAMVMFLSRIVAFAASQAAKNEEQAYAIRFGVTLLLDILLGILGSIFVAWFSRQREFRADAGSAQIAGKERMIAALQALQRTVGIPIEPQNEHASLATLKISSRPSRFLSLFSTHPPLEERIARLQALNLSRVM